MSRVKSELATDSYGYLRRAPGLGVSEHGRAAQAVELRGGAAVDAPPLTNRGVTERAPLARLERREIVMGDSGEIKVVEIRVPTNGQVAMIDTLRFVVHEDTWNQTAREQLVGDEEFVREASRYFEEIFGFGVTADMHKSRDFYANAWLLGDGYGHVAFGGQKQQQTMLVSLSGQGCIAAKEGWEGRLYDFLTSVAKRPSITRIDLAHDCMDGEYTVDQADRWFDEGLFTSSVVDPNHEYRGNWRKPNGQGRTLYIGSRPNGKLCRVYEKGKQLGDAASEWVRFEVAVGNQKRLIPLDVLLDPSGYFVGSYPCLRVFQEDCTPQRIEVKRRAAEINVDASLRNIRASYGKYVGVLRPLLGDDAFLEAITNPSGEWPERLKVPDWKLCDAPLHTREQAQPFNDLDPSEDGWPGDEVFLPADTFNEECNEIREPSESDGHEGQQGFDG